MLRGALLAVLLAVGAYAQCGQTPIAPNLNNKGERNINNEIVGGVPAVNNSWPWQCVWCRGNNPATCSLSCGCFVVHNNWVITAGHCVFGNTNSPQNYLIKAGVVNYAATTTTEPAAQIVGISQMYLHPQYSQASAPLNDIALIRLSTPLMYTNQVQPVCLPSIDTAQTSPPSAGWVTGWGTTASQGQVSPILRQVNVPYVSFTSCRTSYGTVINNTIHTCAGQTGKDSCQVSSDQRVPNVQGDSGGPLVGLSGNGAWFVYGIVSFGQGCALSGYPGVYGRTSAFCSWVSSTTGGDVNCAAPT